MLQYLNNPYNILDELINIGADLILIDRTSFYDELQDLVGVQKVPVKYTMQAIHSGYFLNQGYQLYFISIN